MPRAVRGCWEPGRHRWLGGLLIGAALAVAACAKAPQGTPHRSLTQLWRSYQELPSQRALAVAGDPRRQWVAGMVGGEATSEDAQRVALEQCGQRRAARRLRVPCRIYAVGDEIVWQDW